jgi:Arc/MetJ family transcription regulator
MLNETLLKAAVAATGSKTYSEAVNAALAEAVRRAGARGLGALKGIGGWEGNLASMRGDTLEPRRQEASR